MASVFTKTMLRSRTIVSKYSFLCRRTTPKQCQQLMSSSSTQSNTTAFEDEKKADDSTSKSGEIVKTDKDSRSDDDPKAPLDMHDSDKYTLMKANRIPSTYDKKLLVWGGIFDKESDVPRFITERSVTTAKDRLRVVLMLFMTLTTAIACLTTIKIGQRGRNARIADRLEVDKQRFNQVFNAKS